MSISTHIIQDIKQNVTPVQAIEYYTRQQPYHGRYLCPFHPDRHPSLTVKNGYWRCWSCGEQGDVIDFVRRLFNIEFVEAVQKLSDDFGLNITLAKMKDMSPEERLHRKIQTECCKHNRQQIAAHRQSISDQIDTLTICHRVLMQHGAPEALLDKYNQEIDDLMTQEELWW